MNVSGSLRYEDSDKNVTTLTDFLARNSYTGYVITGVSSRRYKNSFHAVVGFLDRDKIWVVHDPDPDTKGKSGLTYEICEIDIIFSSADIVRAGRFNEFRRQRG